MRPIRLLVPAHIAVSAALAMLTACEDDPTVAPGSPDAASDGASPETTSPDAGLDSPVDTGMDPVDWTKIAWQLLPALPADGVRAGSECDVAVDADDRVLVTYGESADSYAAPRSLAVFRQDGAAWSVLGGTPLVADSGSFATWPRLAVAKDGSIYVAYNHQGSIVQRFAAGGWTTLPKPPLTSFRGILVDSAGMPAVVGANSGEALRLSRFDGIAWSAPTAPLADVDASGGPLARGVLAFAPRPDGSIAALVRTTTTKVGAYTLSGTTWSPFAAELAEGAEFPELSSSAAGHLAAAWSAGENVFAARFDPATEAFVPLGGALGEPSSRYAVTAIDPFDRPFVAWRVPAQPIKVSIFADGAWQSLPDPAVGGRGTLPAIALDGRGLPVLCWESARESGTASEIVIARAVAK